MSDMPTLLVHPYPLRDEGPQGYRLRLACENQIRLADLEDMNLKFNRDSLQMHGLLPPEDVDPELHNYVRRIASILTEHKRVWNHRQARFCPHCLADDGYWRAGWELCFFDYCPIHGVMLIDRCSSCHATLSWNRASLTRCECGSDLCLEPTRESSENCIALSRVLHNKLLDLPMPDLQDPLRLLNIEECRQLIGFLGAGLHQSVGPIPLKIPRAYDIQHSWNISSIAAEIIFPNWPGNFHRVLDSIKRKSAADGQSLKRMFGSNYEYLYTVLGSAAFAPVRDAFATWVAFDSRVWINGRNHRMAEELISSVTWVPLSRACKVLGVSQNRLKRMVRDGLIEGEESLSPKGRKFLLVNSAQFDFAKKRLANGMTMNEAYEVLGLSKKRMQTILPMLFPNAVRAGESSATPWYVPQRDVETVLALVNGLPCVAIPDEGFVSVNHVLRYWNWTSQEIVDILKAAMDGQLKAEARVDGARGISGLIFEEASLRHWRLKNDQGIGEWLTIMQMAKQLGLSGQFAYQLVQNGLIHTELAPTKLKGGGRRIPRSALEKFRCEYVFATEIAKQLGMTSRALRRLLEDRKIFPASGPGVDDAKKLVYRRNQAIADFIAEYEGRNPDGFVLTRS